MTTKPMATITSTTAKAKTETTASTKYDNNGNIGYDNTHQTWHWRSISCGFGSVASDLGNSAETLSAAASDLMVTAVSHLAALAAVSSCLVVPVLATSYLPVSMALSAVA